MDAVATHFEDRTFCYDQLAREGLIALYRQRHKASGIDRFEVVILRVRPAHTWPNGIVTPEHEAYPSSSKWGQEGWTYHTLAAAQTHYDRLLQRAAIAGHSEAVAYGT